MLPIPRRSGKMWSKYRFSTAILAMNTKSNRVCGFLLEWGNPVKKCFWIKYRIFLVEPFRCPGEEVLSRPWLLFLKLPMVNLRFGCPWKSGDVRSSPIFSLRAGLKISCRFIPTLAYASLFLLNFNCLPASSIMFSFNAFFTLTFCSGSSFNFCTYFWSIFSNIAFK